jgi:hypothetical protein
MLDQEYDNEDMKIIMGILKEDYKKDNQKWTKIASQIR